MQNRICEFKSGDTIGNKQKFDSFAESVYMKGPYQLFPAKPGSFGPKKWSTFYRIDSEKIDAIHLIFDIENFLILLQVIKDDTEISTMRHSCPASSVDAQAFADKIKEWQT